MSNIKNPVPFMPVRTTEEFLNRTNQQIIDGYVYFTTDTQKIYLGLPNGEKMSMGGNTGIFYGQKEIVYPEDGNEADPEVIFTLRESESDSDIEGFKLPLVDDLVLNKDGCFYRVVEILNDTSVLTNRITLRGGGASGPAADNTNLRISAPSGL